MPASYKVLAFDPSTTMGVSILELSRNVITTVSCYQYNTRMKGKVDTNEKKMERLAKIGGHILEMLEEHKPSKVVIEGYSYGSKFNHEAMYSVGTVIRYFLWQSGYTYDEIPPTSLKRFTSGSGSAKKDVMLLNVYKNWGYDTNNDNEADAFALAMFGLYSYLGVCGSDGKWLKSAAAHLSNAHIIDTSIK